MAGPSPGNEDFCLNRYREYLRALAEAGLGQHSGESVGPTRVVQEALQKAQSSREQFQGQTEQELAAWLRTILNETLANALRASGLRGEDASFGTTGTPEKSSAHLAELHADPALSPEKLASHNKQLLRLASALERLPEDQRAIVEMKHLHGLSVAEICERTGRSKQSVVGHLYQGLMAVRKAMDDRGEDGPPDQP